MFLKNLLGREAQHGRDFWERHAQHDPLWAILSDSTKKGRKWQLAEFFETGAREISVALHAIAACGLTINHRTALDFGCGVGRLTQALARHFDSAVGVDISPTMIRLAEKLNQHPERVRYIQNARDDIRIFDANTFDFIFSDKVLQHVTPASTRRYLPEFVRTLRKGGVLVFQLPSHPRPADEQGPFLVTPMPDDAYQARIEVYDAPQTATAAPSLEIVVRGAVTNISGHPWSSDYGPLKVANHWHDRTGKTMLVRDDGRTMLPPRQAPGETFEFELAMKAPGIGDFRCEIDLVHEAVCWFADRGSSSVTFPVRVGTQARSTDNDIAAPVGPEPSIVAEDLYAELPRASKDPGGIPMFCVHRDEVVELLRASGAEIVRIDEDWNGGKHLVGYRYFARK